MIFIRTYIQDDWNDICAVHDLARPEELKGSVPPEAFIPLEKAAENEGLFDGKLSVAELDNSVVGFIAWNPDEITWLYVHPEHQRKGIGRELLLYALEQTTGAVTVTMLSGNKRALQLYQSEGFSIVERKKGKLAGNESFPAEGIILEKPE